MEVVWMLVALAAWMGRVVGLVVMQVVDETGEVGTVVVAVERAAAVVAMAAMVEVVLAMVGTAMLAPWVQVARIA